MNILIEEPNNSRLKYEIPLAERMRPQSLDEYVGQEHMLSADAPLRTLIERGRVPSCILHGPPGTGKTSLVRLMAKMTERELFEVNAVSAKVETLRDVIARAKESKRLTGRTSLAFVDEIYHFNTRQQNVLLPSVETGDIILIGTTTENPWFEINKTLLSRMVVYSLKPISEKNISQILMTALNDKERGLGMLEVDVNEAVIREIASLSNGDARQALTRLEVAVSSVALRGGTVLTEDILSKSTGGATQRYDRASNEHYEIISAFIKSIRGSDPDAAIYWLSRMLSAGEDLRFICRRLCISAAEDIGLADPNALILSQSAAAAVDRVGLPEAEIILSELVIYLAAAPKSNSAYNAIKDAKADIESGNIMQVPLHLRNDGKGYLYPYDYPGNWVAQSYIPEIRRFYKPSKQGLEVKIRQRLKRFWKRFSEDE